MTGALGTALLLMTAAASAAAAAAWFWTAVRGGARARRLALLATALVGATVVAATVVIVVALVRHDQSLAYVVTVSEPTMPLYYRVSALWSAMAGSLLLWLLTVTAVLAAFVGSTARDGTTTGGGAAGVLAAIVAAFAVVAIVAEPFAAASGEVGPPPSPLLQDHPAMGVHPPLLYAGFAGLAVPFALSCEALARRKLPGRLVRSLHRWTLVAWLPLTAGVVIGAWWSYAVLGWGGYWAWDPVENASLMPWLLATALLHSAGPRARGAGWRRWTVVLGGLSFLFVLLATFLTRSGVVESIHAFSVSPLGPLLLGILAVAALGWLSLVLRPGALPASQVPAPVISRQSALQANRVLLTLATAIVLVGSLLPTLLSALGGDRVSVGPPWYAGTLGPVAMVLLAVLAVAPWLSWSGDESRRLLRRLAAPLAVGLAATGVVGLLVPDVSLAVTAGLAVLVLLTPFSAAGGRARRERLRVGAYLAHAGIAVGAVAVVAGGHGTVVQETIPIGGTATAGSTSATLVGLDRWEESGRSMAEARIVLADGDAILGEARPQLRWYERQATVLAGPDIRIEPWRDVYVTLLDVDATEGGATVRLAVTPLASWLWVAAALVLVGGGLSVARRRDVPAGERPRSFVEAST